MKNNIINQHQAIDLLQVGKDISGYQIVFDHTKVEALHVILLGKNQIHVPEELIYYDDTATDFSDDPDIKQEDFDAGKLVWNIKASLPVDKELNDWIVSEKIDVDKLLVKLMRNFYETVKAFPNKAAF